MTTATKLVLALTLMAAGRMMTLAFIGRAGDGGPGDPPDAWLMPLIGDAAVGLSALVVAALIFKHRDLSAWVVAIVWSAIGAFDALAAFLVDWSSPWPEFFLLETFGRSMFFAATVMHLAIIALLVRRDVRADFGVTQSPSQTPKSAHRAKRRRSELSRSGFDLAALRRGRWSAQQ